MFVDLGLSLVGPVFLLRGELGVRVRLTLRVQKCLRMIEEAVDRGPHEDGSRGRAHGTG